MSILGSDILGRSGQTAPPGGASGLNASQVNQLIAGALANYQPLREFPLLLPMTAYSEDTVIWHPETFSFYRVTADIPSGNTLSFAQLRLADTLELIGARDAIASRAPQSAVSGLLAALAEKADEADIDAKIEQHRSNASAHQTTPQRGPSLPSSLEEDSLFVLTVDGHGTPAARAFSFVPPAQAQGNFIGASVINVPNGPNAFGDNLPAIFNAQRVGALYQEGISNPPVLVIHEDIFPLATVVNLNVHMTIHSVSFESQSSALEQQSTVTVGGETYRVMVPQTGDYLGMFSTAASNRAAVVFSLFRTDMSPPQYVSLDGSFTVGAVTPRGIYSAGPDGVPRRVDVVGRERELLGFASRTQAQSTVFLPVNYTDWHNVVGLLHQGTQEAPVHIPTSILAANAVLTGIGLGNQSQRAWEWRRSDRRLRPSHNGGDFSYLLLQ